MKDTGRQTEKTIPAGLYDHSTHIRLKRHRQQRIVSVHMTIQQIQPGVIIMQYIVNCHKTFSLANLRAFPWSYLKVRNTLFDNTLIFTPKKNYSISLLIRRNKWYDATSN